MAEVIYPAFSSRKLMAEAPATTVNVGLALLKRRSSAIADFWRSYAEVRSPAALMAVQASYWKRMADDYQEAVHETLANLSAAAPMTPRSPPRSVTRSA